MARPVDDKIVKMRMDSSDFISKATGAMAVFSKLNEAFSKVKSIDTSRSVKSLGDIQSAAGKINFQSLASGVEQMTSKFSALGIIGVTALTNIANKMVNMATSFTKGFAFAPIMDGFREYELKMGSIQTILANTSRYGTTLDDVKASLSELNDYADKTIYNFGDMTRNIGLFTNAGIRVEDATQMIKGFSNEAAASGTSAQGAAGAAYQLSQALSAGTIRLMDWRSLTNVGMGNKNMQNGLIEIAGAMGTLNEAGIDANYIQKDFNASLESNWLSADVMSNYLRIMAGDIDAAEMATMGLTDAQIEMFLQQAKTAEEAATKVRTFTQLIGTTKEAIGSGWAETFELLFGDFDKATEMYTAANDAIGAMVKAGATARNELILGFQTMGGREVLINAISQSVQALSKTFGAIKGAWESVFPPATAQTLYDIAQGLERFAYGLWLSDDAARNVQEIFQSMFTILKNASTGISQLFGVAKDVIKEAFPDDSLASINNIVEAIETFSNRFVMSEETLSKFATIFQAVVSVFQIGIDIAKKLGEAFLDLIPDTAGGSLLDFVVGIAEMIIKFKEAYDAGNAFSNIVDGIVGIIKGVVEIVWNLGTTIVNFFTALATGFGNVADKVAPVINDILDVIKELIDGFDSNDLLNAGFIGALIIGVQKFVELADKVTGFIGAFGGLTGSVKEAIENLGGISEALQAMTTNIKVKSLLMIAVAIGILALSIKLIASVDAPDIAKSLEVLAIALFGITRALDVIGRMQFDAGGTAKAATLLIAVGVSVLLLAAGLKVISTIEPEQMLNSISILVAVMGALVAVMKIMSDNIKDIGVGAIAMGGIAVAVLILTGALKVLASIEEEDLVKGILALGGIFLELAAFLTIVDNTKLGPGTAVTLVIITGVIHILVQEIKTIADIPIDAVKQGLAVMGALLLGLGAFVKLTSGSNTLGASIGIIAVALAINMLVPPIKEFGEMDINELVQGLFMLVMVMLAVVAAMHGAKGALGGALSILVVAKAIEMLVPPLETLGKMSITQVATSLGMLAGVFIIIGVAAAVMGPLAPGLLAFSFALLAIGVATLAVGLGMAAAAFGFTTLAAAGATGVAAFLTSLGLLIVGLTLLVPEFVKFGVALVKGFLKGAREVIPDIIETALVIVEKFLKSLEEHVPEIAKTGISLVTKLIETLTTELPKLIEAGAKFIIEFLDGMGNSIRDNQEKITSAINNVIEALLEAFITGLVAILNVLLGWIPGFEAMTGDLGGKAKEALREAFDIAPVGEERSEELAVAIEAKGPRIRQAGEYVGNEGKEGAGTPDWSPEGDQSGTQYSGAVEATAEKARQAGLTLNTSGREGASSNSYDPEGQLGGTQYTDALSSKSGNAYNAGATLNSEGREGATSTSWDGSGAWLGEGFALGIESKVNRVKGAANYLGTSATLELARSIVQGSPSKVTIKSGKFFGDGMVIGILERVKDVAGAADTLAQAAIDSVNAYAGAFSDQLVGAMELEPTITPVMDLSNVRGFDMSNQMNVGGLGSLTGQRASTLEPVTNTNQVSQSTVYEIHVTANGELPLPTIKKMAKQIQTELKNANDRAKFSRGEAVTF